MTDEMKRKVTLLFREFLDRELSLEAEIRRLEIEVADHNRKCEGGHRFNPDIDWDLNDYEEAWERLPMAREEYALAKNLRMRAAKLPSLPVPPVIDRRRW